MMLGKLNLRLVIYTPLRPLSFVTGMVAIAYLTTLLQGGSEIHLRCRPHAFLSRLGECEKV